MPRTPEYICKKRKEIYEEIGRLEKTRTLSSKETNDLIDKKIKELHRESQRLSGRTWKQRRGGWR